ncbi:probable LRR receptor-like serine/threonine-protein kinase At1g56130 isoform X2 [Magnolia sinica]|uniref:probable LRR receptor-like serine/threonine-protein kinase At1g56130 isoform X2 n=1 Tax=Magnolia sinica TaxID=86752 RepID=UPI0026596874|nr:probable LRR receptor-like serine/threonine-protein kinase At1g56130 isoform X2 [Magnolia sinica]
MKSMPKSPCHTLHAFCFWCIHLLCSVQRSTAQTTDPSEAATLHSIFQQWNISATSDWNISGELCSGVARTGIGNVNLGIECLCTFNNGSTCRITRLELGGNYLTGSLPSSIGNLRSMQYM